ncbi:MAG: outer membrane beta-barrel protein [Saprospiraceae bacterium]
MKKTFLLLASTLLFSTFALAQNDKKIQLGFNLGVKQIRELVENSELVKPENAVGFNLGLDVFFPLNDKILLKSGIQYNFLQVKRIDYTWTFGCDFTGNGFDYFNSWSEDVAKAHMIGIPVEARFRIIGGENHLYLKTGLQALFKVKQNTETTFVECKIHRGEANSNTWGEFAPALFLADLGLGYEFAVRQQFKLYFEPQVEYSLNKIIKENRRPNNSRVLNVGMVCGVRF